MSAERKKIEEDKSENESLLLNLLKVEEEDARRKHKEASRVLVSPPCQDTVVCERHVSVLRLLSPDVPTCQTECF